MAINSPHKRLTCYFTKICQFTKRSRTPLEEFSFFSSNYYSLNFLAFAIYFHFSFSLIKIIPFLITSVDFTSYIFVSLHISQTEDNINYNEGDYLIISQFQ